MEVLYRKYRPQTFADVTGQAHVTRTLVAAITSGRVAHAYLFSGPRGVGKTTTARILAKAVNCLSAASGEPCNACATCVEITEGRCLDVLEIDAASHTGVDHVRAHIIEATRLAPTRARRRVFILDEVHMLSTSASHALLKTLEEPPADVVFILATTEPHRVPTTVQSRCQHFAFRRVAPAALIARMTALVAAEHMTVEPAVFAAISSAAGGSVRDAESLLGQLCALGIPTITLAEATLILPRSNPEQARAFVAAIAIRDARTALTALRDAEADGADADAFLRDTITELRSRTHAAIADGGPVADRASSFAALRVAVDLLDRLPRIEDPFLAIEAEVFGLIVETSGASPATPPVAVVQRQERAPVPPRAAEVIDAEATLARIRGEWFTLTARLGATHPSIPYLLEGGRPQRLDGMTLTIAFQYKLHAAKVAQPKVADAITDALRTLTGAPLQMTTTVVSAAEFTALDAATRPATGDAVADAALAVFGGRVVP